MTKRAYSIVKRLAGGLCVGCGKSPPIRETQQCQFCIDRTIRYIEKSRQVSPKDWIFRSAKRHASVTGHQFELESPNDVPDIPEMCPVLPWIKLGFAPRGGGKRGAVASPSLDRIDPSKGYITGNIRVISWRANLLKKDATPKELIALGEDGIRLLASIPTIKESNN